VPRHNTEHAFVRIAGANLRRQYANGLSGMAFGLSIPGRNGIDLSHKENAMKRRLFLRNAAMMAAAPFAAMAQQRRTAPADFSRSTAAKLATVRR
jgi:hypothetical protein